jgi:F420-dependent oxidoreductase-like protein
MELRIFVEPQQGATYEDQLAVAQAAEASGFGAFFRSDHYVSMGSADGLPGPTDSWVTLGAIARETSTIRLGTLLTSATFRLPGLLAIQVGQVDQMSGGRVELGLGAGWYAEEHSAYGIGFPDVRERFDRLAEQLELITGMWAAPVGTRYSFEGAYYQLADSPALPKPMQRRVPILVGGHGPRRTPALAARFADEFNVPFASIADTEAQFGRVREAATETGRELIYSAAQVVCCGRDETEIDRRAAAIGRPAADLRRDGVAGTVPECLARLRELDAIGASRVYLQVLDMHDLDHLALIGSELLPAVR